MVVIHPLPQHNLEAGDVVSARLLRDNQYLARKENWPPHKFVTLPSGSLCTLSETQYIPNNPPFYGVVRVTDQDQRPGNVVRLQRLFESPGAAIYHAVHRLKLNKTDFLVLHLSKP